jgi:hypothetical protein
MYVVVLADDLAVEVVVRGDAFHGIGDREEQVLGGRNGR